MMLKGTYIPTLSEQSKMHEDINVTLIINVVLEDGEMCMGVM